MKCTWSSAIANVTQCNLSILCYLRFRIDTYDSPFRPTSSYSYDPPLPLAGDLGKKYLALSHFLVNRKNVRKQIQLMWSRRQERRRRGALHPPLQFHLTVLNGMAPLPLTPHPLTNSPPSIHLPLLLNVPLSLALLLNNPLYPGHLPKTLPQWNSLQWCPSLVLPLLPTLWTVMETPVRRAQQSGNPNIKYSAILESLWRVGFSATRPGPVLINSMSANLGSGPLCP